MKKVLHITAHLGGGAGKAISGVLKYLNQYENTVLLLDEPTETNAFNKVMTAMMTEMKLMTDHSDSKIAELLLQGTNMGIIEGRKLLNNKENIDKEQNEVADDSEIKVGSKVIHTFFGYGIVVEADERFIKVLFEKGSEIKKLTKDHPTITKIKN